MAGSDRSHRLRRALTWTVLACVAAALATAGSAQAAPVAASAALEAALDQLVSDGVPGAIAMARDGTRRQHATAGVADLATQEPISAGDRFRIGSNTKSYVSTVVLQLAAERRLRLDDTVQRWLPGLVPNGDAISVRQLLNHTSGLPDYVDLPFYLRLLQEPLTTYRPLDLVQRAVAQPPLFAPGTGWSYSNTNYILLGLIVAAADRVPASLQTAAPVLEVYRRIVVPLRLWDTSFPLADPDIHGPAAHGYAIDLPPEWGLPPILDTTRINPSWAWTAGAIVSTVDDMADFHRALFSGRLLRPAQQRELLTTISAGDGVEYGLGVFRLQMPCGTAWGHNGGMPSHVSWSLISPDGARQAVLMVTRDANTWSEQIAADHANALLIAFCGETSRATARALAADLTAVASLQRVR
jgi:D-alanyl-D-alanine carboxypeptidase